MELTEQMPTLELCKKLKALGYPQEGLFYWTGKADFPEGHALEGDNGTRRIVYQPDKLPSKGFVAPTVAELGEWLPRVIKGISSVFGEFYLRIERNRGWKVGYVSKNGKATRFVSADTEANARAKCLIWLVENNYLEKFL